MTFESSHHSAVERQRTRLCRWPGDSPINSRIVTLAAVNQHGSTDAVRAATTGADVYSFWDYQAGAWQKNNGIRIDHILLAPEAADRLERVGIDAHVRGWEKPSDHVPVWVEMAA